MTIRIPALACLLALLAVPVTARAAEPEPSFDDLVKLAEADYASIKGTPYQEELTGELRVNMHLVFGRCAAPLAVSKPPQADAVMELGADGRVTAVKTRTPSPGAECVEKELKKIVFPKPPRTPFRFFFTISR